MPLVQINACEDQPVAADGSALNVGLAKALAHVPAAAPVVVMIHGFKFSPFRAGRSPHTHILSMTPTPDCWKAVSWPRHLGFAEDRPDDGLCIAFGWEASGSIWRAYHEAACAGQALARLIAAIQDVRPGQRVDVIAHSLGARVVLSSMADLAAGALRHIILMTAAEFVSGARTALQTPAGQHAHVLNVTSRENDLFDFLLEGTIAPHRFGDRALGCGLGAPHDRWTDLQIDREPTLDALRRLGFGIAPSDRRICHWSPYLRPGMFGLYQAFLRGEVSVKTLKSHQSEESCPRWSRLLAPPRNLRPLRFARKAAS